MTRSLLRTVCRVLIGVVLMAQLAVSAYACPGLAASKLQVPYVDAVDVMQPHAADGVVAGQMVNCEEMAGMMDPSFSNLCAEHCHQGQQSDHAATLTVPAVFLTALYLTPLAPEPTAVPRPAADAVSALAAATPPLAILHCCFRI